MLVAWLGTLQATPRDGADVEIIGLLKSTVRWLAQLNASGDFGFAGVRCADDSPASDDLTYQDWSTLIQESFEWCVGVETRCGEGLSMWLRVICVWCVGGGGLTRCGWVRSLSLPLPPPF